MARDPGRRADLDRSKTEEGLPFAVEERVARAASAAALPRQCTGGGVHRLRSAAPRDPAVNPKQGRSWLRLDLSCDRDARPCRRRKPHLDP
jgi:hypothetical protein